METTLEERRNMANWVKWVIGLLVTVIIFITGIGISSFVAYSDQKVYLEKTFETKDDHNRDMDKISKQLERILDKLDRKESK